jgi:GTP-binding protein LepA
MTSKSHIRNFCIIAHIDHGKSTLADRFIEMTQTLSHRQMKAQVLDDMDLEKERGITIKLRPVRMKYTARDGEIYELNLIDTPGHVDFTYEVSRSMAACEGAVLVVDASQGVEAQTLANTLLAMDNKLHIVPVLNKIDLPVAEPERVAHQIEELLAIERTEVLQVSAKTGQGVDELLERIVREIPPPAADAEARLRALIFDSWFDSYRGTVIMVRVMEGTLRVGTKIQMMASGKTFDIAEVGYFAPQPKQTDELRAGQVGYLTASIKEVADTRIGDTVTEAKRPAEGPLPGYKPVKHMVFCGLYPVDGEQFGELGDALAKLALNDSAFSYQPETSLALGFGYRLGFLGLLHMEIVQERLEREFNLALITTSPNVAYKVTKTDGTLIELRTPADLPPPQGIEKLEEPWIHATILMPVEYIGPVLALLQDKRGIQKSMEYIDQKIVMLRYDLPLNEMIFDFHDRLKSMTRGYGSLDYELADYRESDLVKLDILVNGDPVDALSLIVHRDKSYRRGRELCQKMRELIPRQMYEVAIQAAIGNRVLARETVRALRKNVTAKCYGGDISRKRKLLEKQKEGKKRMKQVGRVEIPQEAFMAILSVEQ